MNSKNKKGGEKINSLKKYPSTVIKMSAKRSPAEKCHMLNRFICFNRKYEVS